LSSAKKNRLTMIASDINQFLHQEGAQ